MLHCAHVPDNLEEDNATLPMPLQKVAFDLRETSHEPPRKHARLPLTGANRFYQCFVVHTCLTTRKRTMQHFQCHYKSWRLTIERYCTSHPESMLVFKINKSTLINVTTVNEKLLDISKASLHLLKRTLFLVWDNLNLLCVNLSKEEPSCKFYIIIPRKSIYKFILGINN